jgi:hypothetical protein
LESDPVCEFCREHLADITCMICRQLRICERCSLIDEVCDTCRPAMRIVSPDDSEPDCEEIENACMYCGEREATIGCIRCGALFQCQDCRFYGDDVCSHCEQIAAREVDR